MRGFALAAVLFGSACPALAQGSDSPWLVEYDGEATLVVAPGESSGAAPGRENALYEVGLGLTAERTLQSGWTLGGRAVFRAARDHPARPAGTGNLFATDLQGLGGAFSRLSSGPLNIDEGPRGSLETAYLFLDTGYGEVSLGRDTGVAARFHEGNVSALSRSTLVDPDLDVSGIAAINTRPDITGPSVKLSYVTPRLLGVRAGVSYTPRADVRGLDRDATESGGPFRPELENTVEVGLNASRRLRESGIRLRAGLSYSTAELDVPTALETTYDDRIDVVSVGGEIEWQDTYRFGLNWLGADEGLASGGDYTAWSVGLGYERDDWTASLTYGEAEIDAVAAESSGVSLALARRVNDYMSVAVSWQDRELDLDANALFSSDNRGPSSDGVVFEVTLEFEK